MFHPLYRYVCCVKFVQTRLLLYCTVVDVSAQTNCVISPTSLTSTTMTIGNGCDGEHTSDTTRVCWLSSM